MTTTDLLEQLQRLLGPLDLPDWRKSHLTIHNIRWLGRNIGFLESNQVHPNFGEARDLVARIISENLVK